MRLVMTAMIRDEADIVTAMIEHHRAQGVDQFIITDNGSTDGTTEILERYSADGLVDLRRDPIHRKQQGESVTAMAQDAYRLHGADWVINADADEFWVAMDRTMGLRAAFETFDTSWRSFTVPVIDMTGAPALRGSGLSRLVYRDTRPVDELKRIGLHAHSTTNAVHVGDPDVQVAQGNHLVSIASCGQPRPGTGIEVLHLPWRSWEQFSAKVRNAGRAYDSNPDLSPSPNHHGMRDWRRLQEGTLFAWYLLRHPTTERLALAGLDGTLTLDRTLADISPPVADQPLDRDLARHTGELLRSVIDRDRRIDELLDELGTTRADLGGVRASLDDALQRIESLETQLDLVMNRRAVRVVDGVARMLKR